MGLLIKKMINSQMIEFITQTKIRLYEKILLKKDMEFAIPCEMSQK